VEEWQLICLALLAAAFYRAGIIRVEKREPVTGSIFVGPLSPGLIYRRGLIKKGY